MKKHTKPLYRCRFCAKPLTHTFVDLGMTPLANSYVKKENIQKPENFYPLHTYVCNHCFLVQLPEHAPAKEIFNQEYAYFSSYTLSWLEHAKQYTQMMQERFQFSKKVLVIEIASNDGYLLQYFKQVGIPVLGIEPTINTASVARKKGIKTITQFFGKDLAKKLKKKKIEAKLLIGNNVLAHVPNLNDFISGMKLLLAKDGIITMEFPHLLKLIANNQFDTIYHEHFSYFSFLAVQKIFAHHGITLFDVEEIPTHGGSLRIFAKHKDNKTYKTTANVQNLLKKEIKFGLNKKKTYDIFDQRVKKTKRQFLQFLIREKEKGKTIAGYGAPAKGNTFLNYCGIRTDFIDYTVDKSPHKQGHFLPGTRIPIFSPSMIKKTKPDYLFILPWNIKDDLIRDHSYIRGWGGKFLVAIPQTKVL